MRLVESHIARQPNSNLVFDGPSIDAAGQVHAWGPPAASRPKCGGKPPRERATDVVKQTIQLLAQQMRAETQKKTAVRAPLSIVTVLKGSKERRTADLQVSHVACICFHTPKTQGSWQTQWNNDRKPGLCLTNVLILQCLWVAFLPL